MALVRSVRLIITFINLLNNVLFVVATRYIQIVNVFASLDTFRMGLVLAFLVENLIIHFLFKGDVPLALGKKFSMD